MNANLVRAVRKAWRLGVVTALIVLFAAAAIPALAVSFDIEVTGLDVTTFWGGSYPPVQVADVALYAPNTLYGATVTITDHYVPGDVLASTNCSGLACTYTAPTLTITGAGTAAQYQTALNSVVYSTTAFGAGAGGDRTVTYSIDVAVMPGYFKCSDANHYYYHFDGGYRTWGEARQEALNYRYLGYSGYLVHSNSAAENACINAMYGGKDGWLGLRGVNPAGPYNWVDGPMSDNPYPYTNWGGSQPTDKPVQQYVQMNSGGTWYNVLENDTGSKDGYIVEFGNPEQDSGQPKSGTAIVHVQEPADYTATKSNSTVWNVARNRWESPFDDTFNWTVTVKNSNPGFGTFDDGEVILIDHLQSGPTYGTPTVENVVNITNPGNISCAIAGNVLTCRANGGAVTIGGTFGGNPPGQFDVTLPVLPELPDWKINPTGGICRVDPDHVWIQQDDSMDDCNEDKVYVLYPDLTATKSNNTTWNAGQARWELPFDDPFHWTVNVKNIGEGGAPFFDGMVILRDYLPVGPTYGTPTISNVVNVTNADKIRCAIANNILTCKANGGKATIRGTFGGQPQGQFDVTFSLTPDLPGYKTNPTGGVCRADPDAIWPEVNDGNNDCNQDRVYVIPPDLTATKSASNARTFPVDSWTWTIHVANLKEGKAHFPDGSVILKDDLPNVNIAYSELQIANVTNVTNGDKISCAIADNTLTCTALGDRVTIGGLTGAFDVAFTATASSTGTYANPRDGGICKVDPDNIVPEYDSGGPGSWEDNNDCSHTVYVAILQRGLNGYDSTQDTYISPYENRRDPQGLRPELNLRGNDTSATLISFDLQGQIPSGTTLQGASLSVYVYEHCAESWWNANRIFYCKATLDDVPLTIRVYQMLRNWKETEATWKNATRRKLWEVPGANGTGKDRRNRAIVEDSWKTLGWKSFDISAMVRTWGANPAKNFGVILKANKPLEMKQAEFESRTYRLLSSEFKDDITKRPILRIIYW